ncbi:MAG: hypothetical protein LBH45_03000 [Campylobacteraceae bacterium]|jgi:hypothetical protein|nr:hypothetical protein [Campylobacteraceae bacterium]
MVSKKTINWIVGITSIIFIVLNIVYSSNAGVFYANLLRQTHFGTKNFIVDLPKFYWVGQYMYDDAGELSFFGLPLSIENSKKGIFPMIYLFTSSDINDRLEALKISCDKSLEKSTQKINNWEADVYTCIKRENDTLDKYIVYKDEVFHFYYYSHNISLFNNFQSQYDKFFEGVRLKE